MTLTIPNTIPLAEWQSLTGADLPPSELLVELGGAFFVRTPNKDS